MAEPHQPANANNSSSSSNNVVVSTNAWTGQATSTSAATNAWSSNQISVSAVPSVSVMPITTSVTTVPTMNAVPVASSTTVTASVSNATTSAVPMGSATTSNMTIAQPAVLSNTASTAGTSLSTGAPVSTHPIQGSPSRATLRPNVGTDPTKVLDKVRVADLVREVDSNTQLDEDVEEATPTTTQYLPTPDISHLTSDDYEHVYEPAEDSFLFLDALTEEKRYLTRTVRPAICLEIGSGSGVVSTFTAQLLGPTVLYLTTDINPRAADVTRRTAEQNAIRIEPVVADLARTLEPRLAGNVDVLLFNPPYVVTPPEEVGSSGIEASWAGGDRGREVLDRLLPSVSKLLSPRGVFYLVVIKENNPEEIGAVLARSGLVMSTVMSRRSGPEFLSILKFVWKQ